MIVIEAESAADRDPDPGQESPPDPKETSADVDLRSLRVNAQSVMIGLGHRYGLNSNFLCYYIFQFVLKLSTLLLSGF